MHDTDNVHLPLDNSTDSETPALFKSSNVQSYNDFTITNDQSPTTSHFGTNSQDSETNTYEDGSPTGSHQQDTENDYQTMSDSVRQQAARILANPTTVEQEVRDTITQLRARYQQLQDRIQQQQHVQEQGTQPHARTTTSRTNDGNNEQNLNVVLHGPLYSDQEQGDSIRNSDNKSSGNIGDEVGSKISSTVGGMDQRNTNNNSSASTTVVAQRILYVHHDDDELIALHVLQGLQKQQLRI